MQTDCFFHVPESIYRISIFDGHSNIIAANHDLLLFKSVL